MNVREIISCISGKSNFSQIAIEEFAPCCGALYFDKSFHVAPTGFDV